MSYVPYAIDLAFLSQLKNVLVSAGLKVKILDRGKANVVEFLVLNEGCSVCLRAFPAFPLPDNGKLCKLYISFRDRHWLWLFEDKNTFKLACQVEAAIKAASGSNLQPFTEFLGENKGDILL